MNLLRHSTLLLALGATALSHAQDDPRYTSWYTDASGTYARLYESAADLGTGTAVTTWSRGQGTQTTPTYAGVTSVSYSDNWVYIVSSGLGYHVMGPWYLNEAQTRNFPNYPANTDVLYRIPRNPTVPGTKTETTGGAVGYFVDGVAMFDNRDTFSYINSSASDGSPMGGGRGDGIWNRDAYINEGVTFDPAFAHQAGQQYHYHANAPALRYQLGDHVDYDSTTRTYSEQTGTPSHSPIVAWLADGYPLYGPYGYDDPMDATSGVRRMISGYIKRDGSHGSTNLNSTGRTTLPTWAVEAQGIGPNLSSGQTGPNVSNQYILGHYLEDYAYLGDLGQTHGTDFDLDKYNGRFCVTPEFPEGTFAYFLTIETDGTPQFPYTMGRWFYGDPTGSTVNAITETVVQYVQGAPSADLIVSATANGGQIDVAWNSVEGATYSVESSADQTSWNTLSNSVAATSLTTTYIAAEANYYRVTLSAISSYDNDGTTGTAVGSSGIVAWNSTTPDSGGDDTDSTPDTGGDAGGDDGSGGSDDGSGSDGDSDPSDSSSASTRIVNLSTRTRVGGEAGSPIIGFVVAGSGEKSLIARAVGPTLNTFGVADALTDPELQVQRASDSVVVAYNEDWHQATNRDAMVDAADAAGAFTLATQSADAAWYGGLAAASYTAPMPTNRGEGIVLLELYDSGTESDSAQLTNASTRAWVGTGDNVLISGFVLAGSGNRQLLLRAVGPGLEGFGVTGALADPTMTLLSGDTAVASNNDWSGADGLAAAADAAGAFSLDAGSADAAMVVDLAPGAYTLQVSGADGGTGTALVEIYLLD